MNLEFLFNDTPLYKKETFTIFMHKNDNNYSLNEEEYEKFITFLGFGQKKIITYCHKCKRELAFDVEITNNALLDFIEISNYEDIGMHYLIKQKIRLNEGKLIYEVKDYHDIDKLNSIQYINYVFTCTNNKNHIYMMFLAVVIENGIFKVIKIGQNPSNLTVHGFDFDKYKNELKRINGYDDYKKADLSNAEGFYAGAYTYLRRIFEKILNDYLNGIELTDTHIETKIKAVKNKFDPRIQELLKNLYSILSISIHELDEDVSKEYYEYLKAIIDMQLEYIKTESDKNEQSKSLNKILSKIASDLGKNKKMN